jgi:homoserine kinase
VVIKSVQWWDHQDRKVTLDAEKNTASAGILRLIRDLNLDFGFELEIKKGIALGSGQGGSAASAVAGVFAANALLPSPLTKEKLLEYCIEGEKVASGSAHADNVAPSLFGGMTFVAHQNPFRVLALPVPKNLFYVNLRPDVEIRTAEARQILKKEVGLSLMIEQMSGLGAFITACFKNDLQLMRSGLSDVVIEPQRKHTIPYFDELKDAALKMGVLGFSISGSGPSTFALCEGREQAREVVEELSSIMEKSRIKYECFMGEVDRHGAHLVTEF